MLPLKKVAPNLLRQAMHMALKAYGLSRAHAHALVENLISTSLDGIDTHGIRLFETYLRELRTGGSNPDPQFRMHGALPAIGLLDADHALGAVAGAEAIRICTDRARKFGIAAIAVGNSNHFGAAGYYAKCAATQGMIGLVFSNSDALVVPFNGITALNGTNPLAMAAPALGEEIFCLDMATSQVAFSKIKQYLENGSPIEPGWASDSRGRDSAKSNEVSSLLPLGGYKGQGLGTVVQILTSLLSSMPSDANLSHLFSKFEGTPRQISHFFICIEIQGFCSMPVFQSRLSSLLKSFRESPGIEGKKVIVPGDKERETRLRRQVEGIPLSDTEWELLAPYLQK